MGPSMLSLSDAEYDAIQTACRPLPAQNRDAFLRDLATALEGHRELGPGIVFRTIAVVQRKYFDPPDFSSGYGSKYR
jgi:hypothetical protein